MLFLHSTQSVCLAAALFASSLSALQVFTADTLPSGSISAACASALTSNIDCSRQIASFFPGGYKSEDVLDEACTASCSSALSQYEAAAARACGADDTFEISTDDNAPASFIPQILFYNFNRTCIRDGGRWCNVVARGFAETSLAANSRTLALTSATTGTNGTSVLNLWRMYPRWPPRSWPGQLLMD